MTEPGGQTILDWVIGLVRDPERLEEFRIDPQRVIEESSLEHRQKRVLLSRDSLRIRIVIEYEADLDPEKIAMHLTIPIPMHTTYESPST